MIDIKNYKNLIALLNDAGILPESICSSASSYKNAEDKAGKRQYQASKDYDKNTKYAILNPSKAYENHGLVIFDIDFPVWERDLRAISKRSCRS